ncbi:hypothetical protein ACFFQW_45250 [Umezawaea endophytica]|uniref:Uncharacterized protein n=1 Tax=Umezawaea endophytica TaxID=1654476 RepID=A0A9X2VX86_9PSEU|nr:hypothetical protein [Umezawaea endophytica]MCS7484641.1 hypothetical protein [Umezawaea endophytica]
MGRLPSIRVTSEWGAFPFWVRVSREVIPDNCSAERLVSEYGALGDMAAATDAWDDEFQAVYNRSDPESLGFPGEATTAAWHERGERLAAALPVRSEFHTARGDRVFGV